MPAKKRGKKAEASPKNGSKKPRNEDKNDKFAEQVITSVTCPISHSLTVQPVIAEDGQVYDRERIEKWLQKKESSPITNKPMGTTLIDHVAGRSVVASAIESGLIDAEDASKWHLASARLKIVEKLPDGLDSAKAHLAAAAASPEREMLLKAFKLREQVSTFGDGAAELGLGSEVAQLLAYKPPAAITDARMTEWRPDLVVDESVICIIDDLDELKRLCSRPAPGAAEGVGWNQLMSVLLGEEFTVQDVSERLRSYEVCTDEGDDSSVPFDACILVEV
jgi:hypothetical protein